MKIKLRFIAFILTVLTISICAGTTGKIHGKITNAETGDPIPKIGVILIDTQLGAVSDYEGNYFMINVPPGEYIIEAGGIGYQKIKIEGVKTAVDKSTKIDINLKYSEEYVLTEKLEQSFLSELSDGKRIELLKLKGKDKLKYQRKLLSVYEKPPATSESPETVIYDEILYLTKEIDKLGDQYKIEKNEETKKQIQQEMLTKLDERFTLQEKKMEMEIKKLSKGIEELRKELQKFRDDKELIIQKQFESFTD